MENWAYYLTPSPVHRQLGLVCLGVGAQRTTERFRGSRVLDCHAAVLLTQGSGDLTVGPGGEQVRVDAPALFWVRPGVPHSYGPDHDLGWTESWLLFDGPSTAAYEALGFIPTWRVVFPLRDPLPLLLVLNRLADACRRSMSDIDAVAGSLVHEFLVAARRLVVRPARNEDEKLLAGLSAEAISDLSVTERAARLGVSSRQLRSAIKRAAGCTPSELISRIRVNQAKTLLAETEMPVTEVARAVGFGDPAYFSRHFRASVGMSPRRFRSQQQQFLR